MNSAHTGFYSLIQYCPDRSRLEAANLGVVLLCPSLGFLGCRLAGGNERIRRFFGEQAGSIPQIRAMKRMLENRLKDDPNLVVPENFEKFRRLLANELQITEARPIRVENPQVELAQLFNELVEGADHHERALKPAAFERLDELMLSEQFASLIQRDVTVQVPIWEKEIKIPYTYQNGRLNLIQTQQFHQKTEVQMIKDACNTAVQGHLLYRNPLPGRGNCQLVVVGSFDSTIDTARDRIVRMLKEHDVDFYSGDQVEDLARRILETAH